MAIPNNILEQVLSLDPLNRVPLVDLLLGSLDHADHDIDSLWIHEAEERIDAYERGDLKAVSLAVVLKNHRKPDYWKDRV